MAQPSIPVLLDRCLELSELLVKMCQTTDMKEFWRLDKQFKDLSASYDLEDQVNASL